MPSDCRPRLYTYRLPEAYRDPLEAAGGVPPDGLGRPLRMSEPGIETSLWDRCVLAAACTYPALSLCPG